MISTITFEHGETTCAIEPGKFCRFTSVKGFGTVPWCLLYGVKLWDKSGWLQRCKECMEENS